MSELFGKFFRKLDISRRDLAIFASALLLAFSIWLIHNLSLNYNDFLTVRFRISANLDSRSELSSNTAEVTARVRTSGYNFLSNRYLTGSRELRIKLDNSNLHHLEGDTYYVTSAELSEYSHLLFGETVNIEYIVSDTLEFRFPEEASRKVPVVASKSLTLAPQYMLEGGLKLNPDSVTVYGDKNLLSSVDRVLTEPIKAYGLDNNINGQVKLRRNHKLRYSAEQVNYSAKVTRYVEEKTTGHIYCRNLPEGKTMMVYPSSVEMTVFSVFPPVKGESNEIQLYVDYKDFAQSLSGKSIVRYEHLPEGVIGIRLAQEYVSCVLMSSED